MDFGLFAPFVIQKSQKVQNTDSLNCKKGIDDNVSYRFVISFIAYNTSDFFNLIFFMDFEHFAPFAIPKAQKVQNTDSLNCKKGD